MADPVRYWQGRDDWRTTGVADGHQESSRPAKDLQGPTPASFKHQASEAAREAKSTVAALAEEARSRLADIVDQQKAVGADQVAGVARAAHAVAGDIEQSSPQLARLVKSAAERVEQVAGDIRGSDLSEIVASLSSFGHRRPLVFFGGAVAAGFLLARFLKSDAPAS